jgi:hypothetical protein
MERTRPFYPDSVPAGFGGPANNRAVLAGHRYSGRLLIGFDPIREVQDIVGAGRLGKFPRGASIDEKADCLSRLNAECVLAVKRDERPLQLQARAKEI